jgi:hypothetical protein
MASHLTKLNEVCISLTNASMGVTGIQFYLILLHALPASYEVVATTILASSTPSVLSHSEILVCILHKEGRCASGSALLNAARAALIKSASKGKKEHSGLTCHYCQKKRHIKPDC